MRNLVGRFIASERRRVGLTQAELAQAVGLGTPQAISNIERGVNPLPLKLVVPLAAALAIEADELIDAMTEQFRQDAERIVAAAASATEDLPHGAPQPEAGG